MSGLQRIAKMGNRYKHWNFHFYTVICIKWTVLFIGSGYCGQGTSIEDRPFHMIFCVLFAEQRFGMAFSALLFWPFFKIFLSKIMKSQISH